MDFAFSDEQEEFRATLRRFLAERAPMGELRKHLETERGFAPELWRALASELGLQGVAIPESRGGQGFGFLELGIVQEELGRALQPVPYFSTVCLAAGAIANAGTAAEQDALLPRIASGETIATLAWIESGDGIATVARPEAGGLALEGDKAVVTDAPSSELLVVAARLPGTQGESGVTLAYLPADAAGVAIEPIEALDPTRRIARVRFTGARARALGAPGQAAPALARTLALARIALAFEMVGGAERCLEMAVAYARQRVQFGRPIGSFQAIKHKCAEVLLELESAKSLVYYAGSVAAQATPDPRELALASSLAKSAAIDAYLRASAENVQIHGGVGFTWEYDPHLYYKRAKSSEVLLDDGVRVRAEIAAALGFPGAPKLA
jgi:alkylation response protein AidB-like acyl-CoA dehydrogenase